RRGRAGLGRGVPQRCDISPREPVSGWRLARANAFLPGAAVLRKRLSIRAPSVDFIGRDQLGIAGDRADAAGRRPRSGVIEATMTRGPRWDHGVPDLCSPASSPLIDVALHLVAAYFGCREGGGLLRGLRTGGVLTARRPDVSYRPAVDRGSLRSSASADASRRGQENGSTTAHLWPHQAESTVRRRHETVVVAIGGKTPTRHLIIGRASALGKHADS